ncbi:hypothetical protein LYSHEL_08740 [Lysobacter helvus]|uniref:Glycosyltransferase RgtA/B/C/D-like domain-containing protein n=2 Tax=Lysobacteraceae TaxID=32033 RepID=A0ABM7Q3L6_9GAMM|nr:MULTISPECIES: hypothetical protein [Lysobacter]BCT91850.1 hypothetical protein LYSCAS_08740 [Lysobacter caseinilyticus]BCT95003.1 hypothetical protein LYSHEL_08740 [Lysobacter helvus]
MTLRPDETGRPPDRIESLRAFAFFALVALCLSLAAYHPYYFGDELFSFAFGKQHGGGFADVLAALNAYKPRILMNVLWAAIVAGDWPRWVPMLVFTAGMAASAGYAWLLARVAMRATAGVAIAAGLLVLLSRFNVMLYHDYVSGTIEALSLAAFLAGIYAMRGVLFPGSGIVGARAIATALACFLVAVLIHERYVAGIAGLVGVVVVFQWWQAGRRISARQLAALAALVLVPLIVFVALVKGLSDNPVAMGTSGRVVSVDAGTAKVAGTYALNVLSGTNYGPVWFVGRLNQDAVDATVTFLVCAGAATIAWLLPWAFRRWRPRLSVGALALLAAAFGMIAIASLPGADRQEARWMLPAYALVVLFAVSSYRGAGRALLLLVLGATQLYYIAYGRIESISSILASDTARHLGETLDNVRFSREGGVLVGGTEPDTTWVLGGGGEVFCAVNLHRNDCVRTPAGVAQSPGFDYGFGLAPLVPEAGGAHFALLSRQQAHALVGSKQLPPGGQTLGAAGNWQGWQFARPSDAGPDGLRLDRLAENTLAMPAGELDGVVLVYRAEAVRGTDVLMRQQVNWAAADGAFLGATLSVVPVTAGVRDYPAYVVAPRGAAKGYVYATLHDGATGVVRLESVRIAR